jgi:hypothetical protein
MTTGRLHYVWSTSKVILESHAAVKTELDRGRVLKEAMYEMDDFLSDIGDYIKVEDIEDEGTDIEMRTPT